MASSFGETDDGPQATTQSAATAKATAEKPFHIYLNEVTSFNISILTPKNT